MFPLLAMSALDGTPSMTPGEQFVEPVVRNEGYIDVSVGGTMFRIAVVGVVGIVGADVLGEAKDTLVEAFADFFWKLPKCIRRIHDRRQRHQ